MTTSAMAADVRPFYAGKTITMIVGLPPGGGADAYARLLARHLARHIPGTPAVVVQNLPGAGSLKSVIYLNTAAPQDGTQIATFSSTLINESLTAPSRVAVDFRNYRFIGNVSEDVRVCYVWGASGIKTLDEMRKSPRALFIGASAPGAAGTSDSAMLQNLFGVKLKQVQGYAGSADKRLAIERREIDGDCTGWTALPEEWLQAKKIALLLRLSPTRVAGMEDGIPFGGDLLSNADERRVYDFLTAPERLGRLFMVAGKVPADRVAMLSTAFDAAVKDPAFLAEAARARLLVTPMTGAEVASRVADLYATPPDIVARAKAIIGE